MWAGYGLTHSLRWWVCFGMREELQSLKQQRWITRRKISQLPLCRWRPRPREITTVPWIPLPPAFLLFLTTDVLVADQPHCTSCKITWFFSWFLLNLKPVLRLSSHHSQKGAPQQSPLLAAAQLLLSHYCKLLVLKLLYYTILFLFPR